MLNPNQIMALMHMMHQRGIIVQTQSHMLRNEEHVEALKMDFATKTGLEHGIVDELVDEASHLIIPGERGIVKIGYLKGPLILPPGYCPECGDHGDEA